MFVFSAQISLFLRRNLHFFLSNNNKLSKGREMMLDMERAREAKETDGI